MASTSSSSGSSTLRMGKCEVCALDDARYSCPKCEVKTCSVKCVDAHKRELQCNGIRDRTNFVPLNEMTSNVLQNDYNFLEQCTRFTESWRRHPIKKFTHLGKLPIPLYRMRKAALERGTLLRFLLPNFSRRKENTSFFDWKTNQFKWRIEWCYIHDNKNFTKTFIDTKCDEESSLGILVRDRVRNELELSFFSISKLRIYMKADFVKKRNGQTRCYELNPMKNLRENFAGKTIIEFPTLFVCDGGENLEAHRIDPIGSDEEINEGDDVVIADEDEGEENKTPVDPDPDEPCTSQQCRGTKRKHEEAETFDSSDDDDDDDG